jgi:hypothetical protein
MGPWAFQLQHLSPNNGGTKPTGDADDHFLLFKMKGLYDQYADFFERHLVAPPAHVVELGMWDGGSAVIWHHALRPRKLLAVDLRKREDSPYLQHYRAVEDPHGALITEWGVDQSDGGRLLGLVEREGMAPLDLILDDASHQLGPTRASFDALFPLLRPGGFYVIEDWAWEFFDDSQAPGHPWRFLPTLTELVIDALAVLGGRSGIVSNVVAYRNFVGIQRGHRVVDAPISSLVRRRPAPSLRDRLRHRASLALLRARAATRTR